MAESNGPSKVVKPAGQGWQELFLTRAAEIETLSSHFLSELSGDNDLTGERSSQSLNVALLGHLAAGKAAALKNHRLGNWRSGASMERAISNLDAAEMYLLRLAPASYWKEHIPRVYDHVRQHLSDGDPLRRRVKELLRSFPNADFDSYGMRILARAVEAANVDVKNKMAVVRSFRSGLLVTAMLLSLLAVGLGVWGYLRPRDLAMCFGAPRMVCPIGDSPLPTDILLIELLGMVAASVTAYSSIRHLTVTSTPLNLPFAVALLKLPTGALSAVLGLLLLRESFIPSGGGPDSSAQIFAWAVLFGAAQQIFTCLVDHFAHYQLILVSPLTTRSRE